MHGFHHLRGRMRITKGLEPFPAKGAFKKFLDYLMYVVGIFAPLALLPQIIQLYSTQSAAGLSIVTWVSVTCINGLWGLYGAVHKDRQIFYANFLMASFDLVIVAGILLY